MSAAVLPSDRLLVAVDRDTDPLVLRWAAHEARLRGLALHAVTVWDSILDPGSCGSTTSPGVVATSAQRFVERAVEALDPTLRIGAEAVCGEAGRVLVSLSASSALIVLGSSRRQGNAGMLLGNVAQHVVRHAPCPVVVVPQQVVHVGHTRAPLQRAAW